MWARVTEESLRPVQDVICDILPGRLPGILLRIDPSQPDYHEARNLGEHFGYFFQMGSLPEARAAPGRPKVQQHVLPPVIFQLHPSFAVKGLDLKRGCGVADSKPLDYL